MADELQNQVDLQMDPQMDPQIQDQVQDQIEDQNQNENQNHSSITKDFDRGIKTQFPIARIKRLMQSDEDVGKVAQATPVVVAKALELFMVQLVDASADRARESNLKRIGIPHLYRAIMEEEKFDFLRDIMEKYESQAAENKKPRTRTPKPKKQKDTGESSPNPDQSEEENKDEIKAEIKDEATGRDSSEDKPEYEDESNEIKEELCSGSTPHSEKSESS